ncbi:MAG: hypothetical protein MJE68_11510, partial [Proteobacteria bacterium]|nr:hypothetical protein [Pseudomonadota bacterium]
SQEEHFKEEIYCLASNLTLSFKSCLLSLHPFLDSSGILRVGGREQRSNLSFANLHPVIMDSILLRTSSYLYRAFNVCCMLDPHYSPHFVVIFTLLVVEKLFVLSLVPAQSVAATQLSSSLKC